MALPELGFLIDAGPVQPHAVVQVCDTLCCYAVLTRTPLASSLICGARFALVVGGPLKREKKGGRDNGRVTATLIVEGSPAEARNLEKPNADSGGLEFTEETTIAVVNPKVGPSSRSQMRKAVWSISLSHKTFQ